MASALPENTQNTSRKPDSPSRRSRWTNEGSQSPRRPRTISFSEETRPGLSSSPSSAHYPSNLKTEVGNRDESTATSGQANNRDGPNSPRSLSPTQTSSEPTSDSSSPNSSQSLKEPWYQRLTSNYRSISLENNGSVARDHLALERTFLAWLRTSLAFASIGIAITQLFRLNTSLEAQTHQRKRGLSEAVLGTGPPGSPPRSSLTSTSLTPEMYSDIQTLGRQQQPPYPINEPSPNSASSLLDQLLLQPRESDFYDAGARLRHLGKPLGATFLGISIVILFIGFHRYFESQHWIIRGQFPASRGSIALTGLIAMMLIVASLVIVLVFVPSAYHR